MATANTKKNADGEKNELYSTPVESLSKFYDKAPDVLLNANSVLEPCFGAGVISEFLDGKGKAVFGMDIEDYGKEFSQYNIHTKIGDFTKEPLSNFPDVDCVVMNPPFTLTSEFVDKALEISDNVFMFNRINILESKKRCEKFMDGRWKLRKVWVHSTRVMCPRGTEMAPTANAVCYAWYWFDKNYTGEPTLTWL